MPRAEVVLLAATAALLGAAAARGDEPRAYGKVETFEPGKKYNCVPTADHKGWDCSEIGTSTAPVAPPPAAAPAREAADSVRQESAPAPAATPAAAPPSARAPTANSRELPRYLTNAAASGRAPATPPPRAAAAVPPPSPPPPPASVPPTQVSVPRASSQPPEPPLREAAEPAQTSPTAPSLPPEAPPAPPAPAAATRVAPEPAPPPVTHAAAAPAATARASDTYRGGDDFLDLPGDRFVVELARGASESDLAAARTALNPSRGRLYSVHLRQNGADNWLLVWGSFDSIEAARAARAELAAQDAVTPGWPRKIAPLQAEVRRTLDH